MHNTNPYFKVKTYPLIKLKRHHNSRGQSATKLKSSLRYGYRACSAPSRRQAPGLMQLHTSRWRIQWKIVIS